MISYNGTWLELKDIERITAENSELPYFGTKFAVMAVMKTMIASRWIMLNPTVKRSKRRSISRNRLTI